MKEHKESIIKIGLTVVLFLAAVIVDKTLTLPVFGRILLYVIPYLVAGYEAIAEAFKNIFHGEFFDEAFLMVLATVAAFIIGEYPEAVFCNAVFQCRRIIRGYRVRQQQKENQLAYGFKGRNGKR